MTSSLAVGIVCLAIIALIVFIVERIVETNTSKTLANQMPNFHTKGESRYIFKMNVSSGESEMIQLRAELPEGADMIVLSLVTDNIRFSISERYVLDVLRYSVRRLKAVQVVQIS